MDVEREVEDVGQSGGSIGGSSPSLPIALDAIARLAACGWSDLAIASRTGRPLATVRTYLARVYRRLGVRSRAELVALYADSRADRRPSVNFRESGLSPVLSSIAEFVADGRSDKEIALLTGRPLVTVRTYVARVLAKLRMTKRIELVAFRHRGTIARDDARG